MGLILSVILVYLILVAQFRSFVDPFLILLAVPTGLTGVLLILYLTGTPINVMSLMGMLLMVGISVSDSILIVEFINRLRDGGTALAGGGVLGPRVRLRPVMMTTLATLIGLIPMAAKLGTGSEAYAPLARAIIGGLAVSAAQTVFLVPACYLLMHRRKPIPRSVNFGWARQRKLWHETEFFTRTRRREMPTGRPIIKYIAMSRFAIRYPYLIIVICLIICVVGVTSLVRMPVDLFPAIKIPVVVVATFYSGMPPEQIENDITGQFERMFTLAPGIDHMESRSLTGREPDQGLFSAGLEPGFRCHRHRQSGDGQPAVFAAGHTAADCDAV